MQKIWDKQKGENMYVINESALHRSVTKKKNAASRRIGIVEISLMIINGLVSAILFTDAIIDKEGAWEYTGAIIMMITVVFLARFRYKRKRNEHTFDRTILGELDHAIANSQSVIKIATMMIYYYLIPISIFSIGKMLYFGASFEKWLLIIGLFTLSFFLVRWERKSVHIPRKERLMALKRKLMDE